MVFSYGGGPDSIFGFVLTAVVSVILIAGWVILAGSRFVQGGIVERPERVPQLYGYTMCLVAVLVGLASLVAVIEHAMVLGNPTHSSSEWESWSEPSVTSFEAFRATYERSQRMITPSDAPAPPPLSEAELQRRYEGLRADRIERNRVAARRGMIVSALMLVIAAGLFVFHWRWLRRRVDVRPEAGPVAA